MGKIDATKGCTCNVLFKTPNIGAAYLIFLDYSKFVIMHVRMCVCRDWALWYTKTFTKIVHEFFKSIKNISTSPEFKKKILRKSLHYFKQFIIYI